MVAACLGVVSLCGRHWAEVLKEDSHGMTSTNCTIRTVIIIRTMYYEQSFMGFVPSAFALAFPFFFAAVAWLVAVRLGAQPS